MATGQMRTAFIVLLFVALVSPWVIYRRGHKKRLVCKEEVAELNGTLTEDSAEEQPMIATRRVRRDVEVDPVHRQPIIYVGTKNNSSKFIDDNDFDIVSDILTPAELKEAKLRIIDICNALNTN